MAFFLSKIGSCTPPPSLCTGWNALFSTIAAHLPTTNRTDAKQVCNLSSIIHWINTNAIACSIRVWTEVWCLIQRKFFTLKRWILLLLMIPWCKPHTTKSEFFSDVISEWAKQKKICKALTAVPNAQKRSNIKRPSQCKILINTCIRFIYAISNLSILRPKWRKFTKFPNFF